MASVMTGYAETGITTGKFVRRRRSDGAFWNTSTAAFQSYSAAQIANYGIAATEVTSTGIYTASDPDDATAGDYILVKAAGASLVVGDLTTGLRYQEKVDVGVTANEVADALLDRSNGVETSYTLRQSLRLILSALAAKLSGAGGTTVTIRDINDTKDRITATVDASGNRTALTTDVT